MLVLTRYLGEQVILRVGDTEIRVSPEEINGYQVRLAFDAPDEVTILREELLED